MKSSTKIQKETWKDIIGYENIYLISSCGVVKRLPYKKRNALTNGYSNYKGGELAPQKQNNGYLTSCLCNGKQKTISIHRLVAIAFIPNPNNKKTVNHKDGNKHNNNIENLEWATHTENIQHAIKMGFYDDSTNKKFKPVKGTHKDTGEIVCFQSINDACKNVGAFPANISKSCRGYIKTSKGYYWEYGN